MQKKNPLGLSLTLNRFADKHEITCTISRPYFSHPFDGCIIIAVYPREGIAAASG